MALTPEEEKKLREEIRKKLEEKEKKLREAKTREEFERQKKLEERIRARIREEEEEKFYTEKGYVKYINRHGEVEWITPEEAEHRKSRKRTKKASSRKKRYKRKRLLRMALNLGLIGAGFLIFVFVYKFYTPKSKPKFGTLQVTSNVAGARIYLDGSALNRFTPDTLEKISPGTHYLTVYREGFSVFPPIRRVMVKPNKTTAASFRLKTVLVLEKLKIKANLPDFQLFVDGLPHQLDENNWVKLPVGYHVIAVVKKGYVTHPPIRRLVMEKGHEYEISFNFEKNDNLGILQISSNENRGYVYVDNQLTGLKASGFPIYLPRGIYQIKVRQNGYRAYPENIIVNLLPGDKQILVFQMKKENRSIPVEVATRTPGSSIIVDGELFPYVTPARELKLSPGDHFLNFYHSGNFYSLLDKNIQVSDSKPKAFYYEF